MRGKIEGLILGRSRDVTMKSKMDQVFFHLSGFKKMGIAIL